MINSAGTKNSSKLRAPLTKDHAFNAALNETERKANLYFSKPLQPVPTQGSMANLVYEELVTKFKVDLTHPLQPPPVCLEIIGKKGKAPLSHYGGVTLVTAKAKSGKTFCIILLICALISEIPLQDVIVPHFHEDRKVVAWFDTEQSNYHVQKIGKKIELLSGISNPPNLQLFKLRTEPNNIKKKIIETIIYNTPGLAVVVIDGGRDLINDINSSEEAMNESSELLKWAEDLNVCIIVVLHQNKNDNNARGHYGTELKNKSEFIINVTKDKGKGVFVVEAEDCREKEFEPFAFKIDEMGLPTIVDEWCQKEEGKKASLEVNNIPDEFHKKRLQEAFRSDAKPSYQPLWRNLQAAFAGYQKLADNKAKIFVAYYLNQGWVAKIEPPESGKSYAVYMLTLPV